MNPGLVGGIVGGVLGLAGGAVGTYFSIRNTNGPRERAFMIRMALVTWTAVTAFIVVLMILPSPYRWLLWLPYAVVLLLGIRWCNQRWRRIRAEERNAVA